MKRIAVVFFAAALALSFCAKKKESVPAPHDQPAANGEAPAAAAEEGSPALRLKPLSLTPEAPTIQDDIVAVATLADPDVQGARFFYQWFINGKEVEDVPGEKLERSRFKKGAWIYCRAKAAAGDEEGAWVKSDTLQVLNTLPVLQLPPVGAVRVPGEFQYQAAASDADGDALTFELVAPQDAGIVLDAKTGALSWKIDGETIQRLGENVEIKLAVSDGEGEKVAGTVTLRFAKPRK